MPEEETLAIRVDDIKRLAELIEQNGLSELRYEQGDLRVTLRTAAYRPPMPALPLAPLPPAAVGEAFDPEFSALDAADAVPGTGGAMQANQDDQVRIEAPIMGVFYRAAKPEDPPFVEVGDTIEVGHVVGLIEAMKTFSEVEAEVAGVIQAIPVKNGALVQPGDALIVILPQ